MTMMLSGAAYIDHALDVAVAILTNVERGACTVKRCRVSSLGIGGMEEGKRPTFHDQTVATLHALRRPAYDLPGIDR